ncbi:MAG: lipopolysaccharide biosynthesis protein, partial [Deltaproteobacteria bacterium]|nr:lipopolysaccharide biosynthesis protein [Deltaproteobacteria bacterium]
MKADSLTEVADDLENQSKDNETLGQKVLRGGFWLFGINVVYRVLRFTSTLVLARLLIPSDFGVLAVALLTISLLENFSLTGFDKALIQKKGNINDYLNTAWTISLIRGAVLSLIVFFSASIVTGFFNIPRSEHILRVLALALVFDGMANIGLVFFSRELDFKKLFSYQVGGAIAYMLVSLPLAIIFKSVWALVFGILAEKIVCMFLSYVVHPYRPRLEFDLAKAKELYSFGKWIFAIGIMSYLVMQGDNFFVGKVLGATALGFYAMAFRICNLPVSEMYTMISKVLFPAYSKLQDDIPKLREAYNKTMQVIFFVSFPMTSMIVVLSHEFTAIFLGEKWLPIVPLIKVLSLYAFLRALAVFTGSLFQAVGRAEIDTKLLAYRLLIMMCLMYPFAQYWGIVGVAVAVLCSRVIDVVSVYIALGIIKGRLIPALKELLFPLVGSVITGLVLINFKPFIMSQHDKFGFFILAIMG